MWIQSLLWDKNPAKAFAKAGGRPVLVSAADGTSRAASREVDRLADGDMLAPNLLVVGGAGLTPADAKRLAAAGSWLVWRPVVDQFVLGQTAPPDVFATPGLKILVGAGSRRDGGRGLLAALQAADRYGYLPRERLLAAVTQAGREALQADAASVSRETSVDARLADLAFWDATSFEEAVFDKGRDSLQMVMVGGEVVLCREHLLGKLGRPERLKPVAGQENFFSVIENTECFT